MTRSAPAVLIALAFLGGCARQEAIPRQSSIEFRVNAARLGSRFADSLARLALRAPSGWDALPDSLIAEAMRRVGASAARGPIMLAMYRQQPEGAVLSVARYPAGFVGPGFDSMAVARLGALRRAHPGAQIVDGRFSYHGFEIVQFRTVDASSVEFQLLVSGDLHPLVQLDYVVPRSVYPRELESVESSIGSLEPLS